MKISYGKNVYGKEEINAVLDKLKKTMNFQVIEDAAQSFLSKSEDDIFAGTKYEIGCFSLSVTKLIHMVYGGFCVTNSDTLASKLYSIRNNGVRQDSNDFYLGSSEVPGLNLKPSDLHANIGLINLRNRSRIISSANRISIFLELFFGNNLT